MKNLRGKSVLIVGLVLMAFFLFVFPMQIDVILSKTAKTLVGTYLGYGVYRLMFPREPDDDIRVLTLAKSIMIVGLACAFVLAV